ncbi:hypothetical protein P152DRAFT_456714 [Eremomyces bilateralis CBS 781.70]|uniref:Uncharacterized protein n=1 Tax=Eremomyces bilateralis CBS 781.70 TaxID=1392243 RepID=A0A6G1G981_9PEZI|nr:uncharacterized protein P152DRAFT_456714 [Eremomyces bilateralis CBS 781.70]KAF1814460.1 hypothetical protein P152DRAFT_456714 [Eremomyces bilateralis CBS 781.70]
MSWQNYPPTYNGIPPPYGTPNNANLPPPDQFTQSLPGQPMPYGSPHNFQQSEYATPRQNASSHPAGPYINMPGPQQQHVHQNYQAVNHPQPPQHHIPQFPPYGHPQAYHPQYYGPPVQNQQPPPPMRQFSHSQPVPQPGLHGQPQGQPPRPPPSNPSPQPQGRKNVAVVVPGHSTQHKAPSQTKRKSSTPRVDDQPAVDHQKVLLCLAEEYIAAAHGIAPRIAKDPDQRGLDEYSKLMSTGLGCMEAVLKNFRLHPRQEASLRLRYATILSKETQNHDYAELVLTKSITLCDRNKLLDLKYSSQHLLARVLFETQPRAALKSLDKYVQDVEAYQHVPWIYAFRFLRATLSLQSTSHVDISAGLSNLRSVVETASKCGDQFVAAMAAVMEGLAHLMKTGPESVQQTQHAIAQARKLQQQCGGTKALPIWRLLDCVHLASALQSSDRDQAKAVMQDMHESMDAEGERDMWSDDGSFGVEIRTAPGNGLTDDTGGVFRKTADGRDALVFSWLRHDEVYLLAYYLSGFTMDLHLMNDGRAQEFLKSASIKLQAESADSKAFGALSDQLAHQSSHNLLQWQIRLHEAFTASTREDWNAAQRILEQLFSSVQNHQVPHNLFRWATYLSGLIAQGRGNLDEALSIFQSQVFSLPSSQAVPDLYDPYLTLRILANLHSLLIIRDPAHPKHHECEALLTHLVPFCASHPNRSIVSLYYIVRTVADSSTSGGVIGPKKSLQQALFECKAISNNQLLRVCMGLVCLKFFPGIVSEQSVKSARVFERLSKESLLWSCVAAGNMASTLEVNNHRAEADQVRRESVAKVERLPQVLRRRCEF